MLATHLVTTIGIGRVRINIPVMAQRPQINLPRKVAGFMLYPTWSVKVISYHSTLIYGPAILTVVRVISPHQKES